MSKIEKRFQTLEKYLRILMNFVWFGVFWRVSVDMMRLWCNYMCLYSSLVKTSWWCRIRMDQVVFLHWVDMLPPSSQIQSMSSTIYSKYGQDPKCFLVAKMLLKAPDHKNRHNHINFARIVVCVIIETNGKSQKCAFRW